MGQGENGTKINKGTETPSTQRKQGPKSAKNLRPRRRSALRSGERWIFDVSPRRRPATRANCLRIPRACVRDGIEARPQTDGADRRKPRPDRLRHAPWV